jgi:hypothetical protein
MFWKNSKYLECTENVNLGIWKHKHYQRSYATSVLGTVTLVSNFNFEKLSTWEQSTLPAAKRVDAKDRHFQLLVESRLTIDISSMMLEIDVSSCWKCLTYLTASIHPQIWPVDCQHWWSRFPAWCWKSTHLAAGNIDVNIKDGWFQLLEASTMLVLQQCWKIQQAPV